MYIKIKIKTHTTQEQYIIQCYNIKLQEFSVFVFTIKYVPITYTYYYG